MFGGDSMNSKLREGLEHFRNASYKKYKNLYKELENQQHPHTLFIACSDSRVSPELLTDSHPGDVFVVRNIANTVPVYSDKNKDLNTASAIEFALEVLEVEQIIICGHSNCGGCAAAMNGIDNLSHLPNVKEYLKPLDEIRQEIERQNLVVSPSNKAELMERMNAVTQLNHLKEYPSIQKRLNQGTLIVEAWHYDIGAGDVQVYDEKSKKYQSILNEASVIS